MVHLSSIAATAAAAVLYCATAVVAENEVFAHVIVGNTFPYTYDNVLDDVKAAAAVGINGFALNLANRADEASAAQQAVGYYYQAAEAYGNGFSIFISFDYPASDNGYFSPDAAVQYINTHKDSPAQFKVNGVPFASTFEGPASHGDWAGIKSSVGGAYFVPDYDSVADKNEAAAYAEVDGLFTWDAWPEGAVDLPDTDGDYSSALSNVGKAFMMSVSPWFFADTNGKRWLWRGDSLWHERWQQVYQYKPQFVEILTWNDWGESHYIAKNPPTDAAYPDTSPYYNKPSTHEAWLNDLPYYIAQYKNGGTAPADGSYTPHVTFWYRMNPGSACPNVPCNNPQYQQTLDGGLCDVDEIFFTVFTGKTATVNISIGGVAQPAQAAQGAGVFHGSVPFNGQLGAVTIDVSLDDGSTMGPVNGPEIKNECVAGWNAWVGGS